MGAGKTSTKKCAKCEFQVWFLFRPFFSDARAEARAEVSYKGNNFCYKACPVANSFFCLTHTRIHSRTEQQSETEKETLVAFFLYFCMASSWYFLSFFLRSCSPSASNELNGMKLKVTTRIFVLHLQENVRNYKHKSAKGKDDRKGSANMRKNDKIWKRKVPGWEKGGMRRCGRQQANLLKCPSEW